MTWIRLDDKFWRNPKMRRLSHAARGVFCDCLSYCGDVSQEQLTGYLSHQEALERATGSKRLIDELAAVGALEAVNGGYLIHDFPEYLPKTSRERTQQWRERKRLERHGDAISASQSGHGDIESSRARDGKPEPVPEPEPVPVGDLSPFNGLRVESRGHGLTDTESIGKILGRMQMTARKESK